MKLRIHAVLEWSSVNGPGERAVIWVQGCSLGCADCWNPLTHPHLGGTEIEVLALCEWAVSLYAAGAVSGVTISGGEPMKQTQAILEFVETVHVIAPDLSIGMFSGFSEAELERGRFACFPEKSASEKGALWQSIRSHLDFAVLGRYDRLRPSSDPLITSSNQQLRLYTDRYTPEDFEPQSFEISISESGLTQITGFPIQQ